MSLSSHSSATQEKEAGKEGYICDKWVKFYSEGSGKSLKGSVMQRLCAGEFKRPA